MILSVCRAGDEKRWEGANFNITNERQSMVNSGAGTAYPSEHMSSPAVLLGLVLLDL